MAPLPMADFFLSDVEYPRALCVKNTFIDIPTPGSPQARGLHSCPGSAFGLAQDSKPAAVLPERREDVNTGEEGTEDLFYPEPYFVKNTFIDVRTPLAGSFVPRGVSSCPGSAFAPVSDDKVAPSLDLLCEATTETGSSVGESDANAFVETDDEGDFGGVAGRHPCASPCPLELQAQPLPLCVLPGEGPNPFDFGLSCLGTQPAYGLPDLLQLAGFADFAEVAGNYKQPMENSAPVLLLSEMCPSPEACVAPPADVAPPAPLWPGGLEEGLPSMGSAGHYEGQCVPCAFTARGCTAERDCKYCHLCDPGEHKRRKKEKRAIHLLEKATGREEKKAGRQERAAGRGKAASRQKAAAHSPL